MTNGNSLNRKDVIKQKILTGQGEINTITKSTGKYSRLSISFWVFYAMFDNCYKKYNAAWCGSKKQSTEGLKDSTNECIYQEKQLIKDIFDTIDNSNLLI